MSPRAQGSGEGEKGSRRDPFESLVNRQKDQNAGKNLPPGKAGLQVSTLRLDGIVRSSAGMIAVVSNPQARTYFLREGDQLYDGRVDKIAMDGVSFHELGKDAFGKPVERSGTKENLRQCRRTAMTMNRPAFRIGCLISRRRRSGEPVVRTDAGARRRVRDGFGDLQRGGDRGFAA